MQSNEKYRLAIKAKDGAITFMNCLDFASRKRFNNPVTVSSEVGKILLNKKPNEQDVIDGLVMEEVFNFLKTKNKNLGAWCTAEGLYDLCKEASSDKLKKETKKDMIGVCFTNKFEEHFYKVEQSLADNDFSGEGVAGQFDGRESYIGECLTQTKENKIWTLEQYAKNGTSPVHYTVLGFFYIN